jgi:curved DNA-binding protein CbpA
MLPRFDDAESAREILGVDADASVEAIRSAYLGLVKAWHPDRFANQPSLRSEAEAATKRINDAYRRLCRPDRARRRAARRSSYSAHSAWPRDRFGGHDTPSPRIRSRRINDSLLVALTLIMSLLASAGLAYLFIIWDAYQ